MLAAAEVNIGKEQAEAMQAEIDEAARMALPDGEDDDF